MASRGVVVIRRVVASRGVVRRRVMAGWRAVVRRRVAVRRRMVAGRRVVVRRRVMGRMGGTHVATRRRGRSSRPPWSPRTIIRVCRQRQVGCLTRCGGKRSTARRRRACCRGNSSGVDYGRGGDRRARPQGMTPGGSRRPRTRVPDGPRGLGLPGGAATRVANGPHVGREQVGAVRDDGHVVGGW